MDRGALAHECVFDWDALSTKCSALNQLVFVSSQGEAEYYDGQKIDIQSGKCAVQDGVYKYISRDERSRTVPKLEIVDSKISNPAYIEWLEAQEDIEKTPSKN